MALGRSCTRYKYVRGVGKRCTNFSGVLGLPNQADPFIGAGLGIGLATTAKRMGAGRLAFLGRFEGAVLAALGGAAAWAGATYGLKSKSVAQWTIYGAAVPTAVATASAFGIDVPFIPAFLKGHWGAVVAEPMGAVVAQTVEGSGGILALGSGYGGNGLADMAAADVDVLSGPFGNPFASSARI